MRTHFPHMISKLIALAFLTATLAHAEPPPIALQQPDGTPNRAVWMAAGRMGVMVHYLLTPVGATRAEQQASVDRAVDAFDRDGFLQQLDEAGADWLIFTLTQVNGVLNSANPKLPPEATMIVPRRDLALEIAQRRHAAGKRVILYLPSDNDGRMRSFMGAAEPYTPRYREFVRAYSEKFGRLCDGWWFDACGPLPDAEWQDWIAACRAGNPDAALAFSGAEFCTGGDLMPRCPLEDYHAGEIHVLDDGRIRRDFLPPGGTYTLTPDGVMQKPGHTPHYYMPDGQFIGNVQWHALLPIDMSFNPAIPARLCRYSDAELFGFVKAVKSVRGAVTINVPIDLQRGLIPADSHAQLVRLRHFLDAQK